MMIAKASQEDLDAATKLIQLLNAIDGGNFPPKNDDEDWPVFDEDNRQHLQSFLEDALDCFNHPPSGLMRVLYAASCALDPANKLYDPKESHLAFHPRIEAADALLAAAKAALESLDAIGVPQEWDCRAVLREAIAKAGGL